MNDSLLKRCLVNSFTAACWAGDLVATPEHYAATKTPFTLPFDTAQKLVSRFWTNDYLDDLVVNDGSGIYLPPGFVLDFGRRFWGMLVAETYAAHLDVCCATGNQGDYNNPQENVINMVTDVIMLEKQSSVTLSLLSTEVKDYYLSVAYCENREQVKTLVTNNSWLVPLYLLFVTGCYDEIRLEISPTH